MEHFSDGNTDNQGAAVLPDAASSVFPCSEIAGTHCVGFYVRPHW